MSFEAGKSYMATPSIKGARQIVVACTGRRGGVVTFARVEGLYRVRVDRFEGREMARIIGVDGLEYFTSSTVPVDLQDAAAVLAAIG